MPIVLGGKAKTYVCTLKSAKSDQNATTTKSSKQVQTTEKQIKHKRDYKLNLNNY